MGTLVGLQLLSAVVISLVLNAPVLLVHGGTGRTVVGVVLAVLLVLVVVAALGHRRAPAEEPKPVWGTGTRASEPERADLQRWMRRGRRLARLQAPVLLLGLVGGSVAGAALGSWWWEALGGAVGYGGASALLLWLMSPHRLLSGPRRPPRPGAPGLR